MSEARFRFEKMEIWQRAADICLALFDLADVLDRRKYFRFGEQLRAVEGCHIEHYEQYCRRLRQRFR